MESALLRRGRTPVGASTRNVACAAIGILLPLRQLDSRIAHSAGRNRSLARRFVQRASMGAFVVGSVAHGFFSGPRRRNRRNLAARARLHVGQLSATLSRGTVNLSPV